MLCVSSYVLNIFLLLLSYKCTCRPDSVGCSRRLVARMEAALRTAVNFRLCADNGGSPDGGAPDGGAPDGGAPNGGAPVGGAPDGGGPDGGALVGGPVEGG